MITRYWQSRAPTGGDIFLIITVRNKPSIPVSSRVTSIIRLECWRNKWSNHPPTLTIWRKQSSTAIHPYIVARTKSLATADLRYALYINQLPPPPPLSVIPSRDYTHPSHCVYAISQKGISNIIFATNFILSYFEILNISSKIFRKVILIIIYQ